jgi:DNA polymerase-1
LQFAKGMRDRVAPLLSSSGGPAEVAESSISVDGTVLATGELAGWLSEHASGAAPTGVVVAGHWGRGSGDVTGLAFAVADGVAAFVDVTHLDPKDEAALGKWLADSKRPKVMHDAKGPMLALAARGFELRGLVADTALEAYLVLQGQRSFELADVAQRMLNVDLRAPESAGGQASLFTDDSAEADLRMKSALAVLSLAEALREQLEETDATPLLTDVELPLVRILADMERTGIGVDSDRLDVLMAEFTDQVKHLVEDAHTSVGIQFNLGSPKQLQEVLFDTLGLPKTKKIKTGYTTDADALTWLAAQTENELPRILLRHREVNRLRTVVDGLIKSVSHDGLIHTTYNQMGAATGRFSSTDPNLQNIPIRTAEGQRIRHAFVAGEGFESLMTADYSQIEMRIMAHLSGDEALIEAFTSGEDLHNTVASKVFTVEPTKVDAEQRRRIKAMSYGLAYGLSSYGLSQQLGIEPGEATKMMEDYFARFGGIRDYLHEVVAQARVTGYTETILGRRRYLPDLTSDVRQRREAAERMALNAPIQGSAADIIKVAMIRVRDGLASEGFASRILLQVHDELVLEIAPGERKKVEAIVRREMGSAAQLRVPLDVSVGSAQNWAEAAH